MPFIAGPVCKQCGAPILASIGVALDTCEDCFTIERPWREGRSALIYKDAGRKFVLALKNGDRAVLGATAAPWMAGQARAVLEPDTLIAPVPLHWIRLLKRRYNQSAALAQYLALTVGNQAVLDLLHRLRHTRPLDGATAQDRFARLEDAISVKPGREGLIDGAHVLLVDDVMTSGATLASCTRACYKGGARQVDVLVLARAVKDH